MSPTLYKISSSQSYGNYIVDSMYPMLSGSSRNQPLGLAWGWFLLTSAGSYYGTYYGLAPLPSGSTRKVIILVTDGLNSKDRWYGNGYDPSPEVDVRQKLICDNIKASGVTIYTIQLNTRGADSISTATRDCASAPDKFFLLTSASQISLTFTDIGTALTTKKTAFYIAK